MEANAAHLLAAALALLGADHAVAGLVCLVAHQHHRHLQHIVLEYALTYLNTRLVGTSVRVK